MKRTRNFVLALSASAMLALGATAPAFAGPPVNPGSGACDKVPDTDNVRTAKDMLGCDRVGDG